ncbi:sugar ABC transporter [Brucella inopinata BO1]|nr:sugar ABC transporter [Brucella pinnipedialis M163/99/10]EEY25163.1 ABC sugar transporter [Brucella sp. F5/99]EEZ28603.1 ribose ABC transporter ATP-binding protein [Brucella pinnipedialis M292/94/1]KEY00850.1 sugar ABC transporter [Brucella inopinata BO1]PXG11977.1 sugar ABC transporter ATP-binding protein [Brucella abortus]
MSAGMVQNVDMDANAGEIIGIGGLVGQGQEDFLLGLYGALPTAAREAIVCGNNGLFKSVGAANAAGLAYVPADRKREGLVLPHSIASNLLLPSLDRYTRHGLRNTANEQRVVAKLAERLTIRGDTARPVQALSGGNQQKVALAKWLPLEPTILLLNDPTRGVDIETKREIYLMLRRFADEGKLVVLLSSDTPELVHLCDRVMVFREGRMVATLKHGDLSEEAIVGAAMGLKSSRKAA